MSLIKKMYGEMIKAVIENPSSISPVRPGISRPSPLDGVGISALLKAIKGTEVEIDHVLFNDLNLTLDDADRYSRATIENDPRFVVMFSTDKTHNPKFDNLRFEAVFSGTLLELLAAVDAGETKTVRL